MIGGVIDDGEYAAPTLTELLAWLPGLVFIPPINLDLYFFKGTWNSIEKYQWGYSSIDPDVVDILKSAMKMAEPINCQDVSFTNENPAESAGKLLCWLAEKGHIQWLDKTKGSG